ncbi:hypothetical protein [Streptomyces tagetis]|uniref:Uncharacterized protein n=1 Tax=Streptomyces tagetis TaxID=2820809 RepID=A0A940XCC7_9ACTN|nr:hypothetical protein [Streptomyces sp. RG38]MBQ0827718.1 hypothetical protein [Streptomyces sp. RG38]
MAFPEEPLGLRAEMLIDGVWTDFTKDVYTRAPITHQRGVRNEGTVADPASVPLTINNRSGKYSPRNPMSPYYGKIGRNTRVRLTLPGGTPRMVLPPGSISRASTPDTASINVASIDVRIEVNLTNWDAGQTVELCGKYSITGLGRAWLMLITDQRRLAFRRSIDGTGNEEYASTQTIPFNPGRMALRSTWHGPTGIYTHYIAPSITGPWTQLGAPSFPGTPGSLFPSTAPLEIGDVAALGFASPQGSVYAAQLRNGIDGPIAVDVDFTALEVGAASFTDRTGLPWTLAGGATISDREVRFLGEISEWPQQWAPSGADAWVPVQAAGILRRLGRGTKSLDSALRRRIPSYEPMAYWPMEEGENASRAYSPIAGVDPLSMAQVQWAADSSLPSSGPLPTIQVRDGAGFMSGLVRNGSWTSLPGWSVHWLYRMPQVPASRRTFMMMRSTGTVRDWYVQSGPDHSRVLGMGYDENTIVDVLIGTSTDIYGDWVKCSFSVEQEGANVRWRVVWSTITGDAGGYTDTVPGVTGRPTGVSSPPGGFSADLNGMAIGHIGVWPVASTGAYTNAMNAWSGETAGARMLRLASEEGIPVKVTGAGNTEPVGYQGLAPVLDLVRTAATADGGLLTEDPTALRLLYRPRSTLYSQAPALVLDYAAGQIAAPLDPVDDDTNIRNDITVSRDQGSSTRAVLASGPLSVQDPPDGVGVYDDSLTLSLATDEQTVPLAHWELHLGTWDEPRYPAVTVNLHRHPELIPAVLALREGDVIRLVNMPKWLAPDDVDLMYLGLKETLLPRKWTVTFDCVPAGPWWVGIVGHGGLGRVDTDGSQLAGAVSATASSLPVAVTAGALWQFESPFEVRVGGEVMRVTGITGASPQTFTVVRSVNGIKKPHSAGALLRLATPSVVAL